jgi:hypothetical protein
MNKPRKLSRLSANGKLLRPILILAALALMISSAQAQGTQFTYQGKLNDNGSAANGNYDLQFKLFDTASVGTGAQQGSTVVLTNVTVTSGLFTVQLDFGAGPFPGANRFLEIGVKPTSGASFTVLGPRQPVTSTPYAIRSASANNANQLGGVAASQYVVTSDTRLTNARPPTAGSTNYIQNGTTQQAASNFNINGNGTANTLFANTVNAGIVSASRYHTNGATFASGFNNTVVGIGAGHLAGGRSNAFFGTNAGQMTTTGEYNSFFGNVSGLSNTTGSSNSIFGNGAGASNTSGGSNSFFGNSAGASNKTGSFNSIFGVSAGLNITASDNNSFFGSGAAAYYSGNANTFIGFQAGAFGFGSGESNTLLGAATAVNNGLNNATAIGANAIVTQSNSLVLGSINSINRATADTRVGIGTSAPQQKLHLSGPDSRLRIQSTAGAAYTEIQYHTNARIWNTGVGGSTVTSPVIGKYYIYDESAGLFRMAIDTNGRVGIGTTSPDLQLSVNGGASKPGGGSWSAFSDLRLKNIKGRFTPGLNALMQLQPLRYEYKRDNALKLKSDGQYVGFSAQAVQRVIPEAVTKNEQGYLLVNNDPILWTMLNAIKEQQAQIQQQQKQIDGLKRLACRAHRRSAVCR